MANKEVTQVIETKNESGSGGTVTVITTYESGNQTATRSYDYDSYRSDAIEKATQDSLNK